jgi:hypothetical protein
MFVSAGIGNKAAASAKVIAKDAGKGVSTIAAKVAQADVGASARRLANKVCRLESTIGYAVISPLHFYEGYNAKKNIQGGGAGRGW